MADHEYKTEQEDFWAGRFGENYIKRNNSSRLLSSNIELFGRILAKASNVRSVLELGCNIGMNLHAIHSLRPDIAIEGVEINEKAIELARKTSNFHIYNQSIIEPIRGAKSYDFVFSKTVLIHICPDHLQSVYENLVGLSNRYIMIAEYYNPNPVSVKYRGHHDKLFKRDFAGELMDNFKLRLIDYGFVYHKDKYPQDDVTWFSHGENIMNLAIIPARGGSKRLKRKNIKIFAGIPMIGHAIKTAFECMLFDKILVSTDDNEIATIAKSFGAEVPFMRSKKLASDHTPTVPVIKDAIQKQWNFEASVHCYSYLSMHPATASK